MNNRQTMMRDRVVHVISKAPRMRASHEIDAILPWLTKRTQMLQGIDKSVLMELVAKCGHLRGRRDDVIIRQGDRGDRFFIILTGTVAVYIDAQKSGEDEADDFSMSLSRSSGRSSETSQPRGGQPTAHAKQSHACAPNDVTKEPPKTKAVSENIVTFRDPLEDIMHFEEKRLGIKGKVDRSVYGKYVIKFGEGKCFGEIAMISEDNVRNATIICDGDTDLMVIHRDLYNRTLKMSQEREFLERREFANNHPMFKNWSPRFRRLLEMSLIKETLSFDSNIIRQGDAWEGLVFIRKGRAKILVEPAKHNQQYEEMLPFIDHNDTYELEMLRPPKPKIEKKKTGQDLQQGHVAIRRREGYVAAEKRRFQREINISSVSDGEVFGDTELIMGLDTYMQTVRCTTATDVFILTPKNYERLITKKNPAFVDKLRMLVETKMRSRLDTVQGNQVPFFKHIFFKMKEERRPQPRIIPPLRSTKELPDKEILFEHLLKSFRKNKAELVEPYVPGSIYFREMMREKASIRANVREKQKKYKTNKPIFRRSVKLPPPKRARTLKELKMALNRQQNESEDLEKRLVLQQIRELEEEMLKRDYEKRLLMNKLKSTVDDSVSNNQTLPIKDTSAAKLETIVDGASLLTTADKDGAQESSQSIDKIEKIPLPPILITERSKTIITEYTESEPGDLQAARAGNDAKVTRDVHSAQAHYAETSHIDDITSAHPVLPPIGSSEPASDTTFKKPKSKKEIARMKFFGAIMHHKLQVTPENPNYRDWETNDRSMKFLEERVKQFTKRTSDFVGMPPPVGLPKLKRFQAGEEELNQPLPGGKVFVRHSKCALANTNKRLVNHKHERYRMVQSLPNYDEMRRNKMMMHLITDDLRQKWVEAQPKT